MQASEAELGWLAGVFDCDSSLYIARLKRTSRPRPYSYRTEITVEGIDPRKPYRCFELTGLGEVWHNKTRPVGSPANNTVKWRVRGRDAVYVAQQVAPYMVSKKEQAELIIQFGEYVADHWTGMTDDLHEKQKFLYEEMPRLKNKHILGHDIWESPAGGRRMNASQLSSIKEAL